MNARPGSCCPGSPSSEAWTKATFARQRPGRVCGGRRQRRGESICVIRVGGGEVTRMTDSELDPAWRADGSVIAFQSEMTGTPDML
jgi:hypothetical protein